MKNNYEGFRGWINYIRDYKDNIDNDLISEQKLIDANKEIEKLKDDVKMYKHLLQEENKMVENLDARIQIRNSQYSGLMKERKTLQDSFNLIQEDNSKLEYIIDEKNKTIKQLNMKYAQSQRRIKKLNSELEKYIHELAKKDHKINFLQSSKHAPTKEEIIAYETQMKAVEKKYKASSVTMKNDEASSLTK